MLGLYDGSAVVIRELGLLDGSEEGSMLGLIGSSSVVGGELGLTDGPKEGFFRAFRMDLRQDEQTESLRDLN